jgi:hypothetical protein
MNLNESITIKKKHIVFAALVCVLYVYLNDAFENPSYQEQVNCLLFYLKSSIISWIIQDKTCL